MKLWYDQRLLPEVVAGAVNVADLSSSDGLESRCQVPGTIESGRFAQKSQCIDEVEMSLEMCKNGDSVDCVDYSRKAVMDPASCKDA